MRKGLRSGEVTLFVFVILVVLFDLLPCLPHTLLILRVIKLDFLTNILLMISAFLHYLLDMVLFQLC